MRISYFNREMGTYSRTLPDICDGVVELPFVDIEGRHVRLLDAVGDREKWTIHARPGCQIRPAVIDGDAFSFDAPTTHCVLRDGFACQVITASGAVYFTMAWDNADSREVCLVNLPLDRAVWIGFSFV